MLRTRLAMVVLVVGALSGMIPSRADDPPPAQPTPHHKLLSKDAGTWDASIKMWTPGSNTGPNVSKGVETNTMLGGLWLVTEFKGEFGGQTFEGRGQLGYDTSKGKYVSTWIDTMGTELMIMEGDFDEKTSTLTLTGKGSHEGKPYEAKEVTEHKGDDTRVFTMLMKSAETKDEMVKVMEITYTRRSK